MNLNLLKRQNYLRLSVKVLRDNNGVRLKFSPRVLKGMQRYFKCNTYNFIKLHRFSKICSYAFGFENYECYSGRKDGCIWVTKLLSLTSIIQKLLELNMRITAGQNGSKQIEIVGYVRCVTNWTSPHW